MAKKNNSEWVCKKSNGNNEIECESQRGNAISLNKDGSARFTKFSGDEVRVNGRKTKFLGVELH